MITLSVYLSKGQKDKTDYYLGGNDLSAWSVALSTMATQCSTNSLLGAPAFVAFSAGGGLIWLQYELALPLAMIGLILFVLPIFRHLKIISVYSYLEGRFDLSTRLALSLFFQVLRAFSTGVIVYGVSLVLVMCLDVPFWAATLGLGVVTVVYDMFGGMKAVVISDVIQMGILFSTILLAICYAVYFIGGVEEVVNWVPRERVQALDFSSHGLGDGKDFGFWPMLFGGVFLYMAYYGTDQSQVQRELSTRSVDDTNQSLFLNGIFRFPLVFAYCFLGLCLSAYAAKFPEFLDLIPLNSAGTARNYNLAVPMFVIDRFPVGLVGLVMVGLFAAAMSSLDSVINSLSAVTLRDFVQRLVLADMKSEVEIWWSRGLTLFWGVVCVGFAFFVENISDSVIVTVNKIGSLTNGSILGVFLLGLLTQKTSATGANMGLILGVAVNTYLWIFWPSVSWLWGHIIGVVVTMASGVLISQLKPETKDVELYNWSPNFLRNAGAQIDWSKRSYALVAYFFVILALCFAI